LKVKQLTQIGTLDNWPDAAMVSSASAPWGMHLLPVATPGAIFKPSLTHMHALLLVLLLLLLLLVCFTCSEFTSPGKCVPERLLREPFDITNQANATYWLVVNAALSDKSYDFGVYTATSQDTDSIKASTTAAQPEAATPAYSVDGEYMYEPSDDPMNAKRGQV
jgi:hypothetical protein